MNVKLAAMYLELYSYWNTHACTCVGQCFPDHLWRVAHNRHRHPVLLMVKQRYHFTAFWIMDHMYKEDEWKGISVPKRSNHRVLDMLVVPQLVKKFPHQHVYNSFQLVCILSDESKHNLPPYFLKNLQSTLVFKTNIFFQMFQPKPCMFHFSLTCATSSAYQYLNATFCVLCGKITILQWSMCNKCQWYIISDLYKSHNIPYPHTESLNKKNSLLTMHLT